MTGTARNPDGGRGPTSSERREAAAPERRRHGAVSADDLTPGQRQIAAHREGHLLVRGAPASGKTEALAHRMAQMAGENGAPALMLTSSEAGAARLRDLVDSLEIAGSEELLIGTWETIGEGLLREEATEAALDPFFDVLAPAERLAIIFDRLDDLPLRMHEIRGNPIGLLRGLLRRIDSLKRDGITAAELAEQADRQAAEATDRAAQESAERECEFAQFFSLHDRILADRGSVDRGDIDRILARLLESRAGVRERLVRRFDHLVVEELEDLGPARWALLEQLARDRASVIATVDEDLDRDGSGVRFFELDPTCKQIRLEESHRQSATVRFRRCANERAEAQSTAREIEDLIASGTRPEEVAIFVDSPANSGSVIGAALEERSIPFRISDPVALFRRPEVRDAIAWLRVLADPDDSAAAARALTRPPIQLGSADLARLTTIARRRKLNLVAAGAAALESPQFTPEARERIDEFLRLHQAASAAMPDRRADVFVRRLIERVGLRKQRMFSAQAEVAGRLRSLSGLAEIAGAWSRREPHATTRDFVRYVKTMADAGTEFGTWSDRADPGTVAVIAIDRAKGLEFAHVFLLGLTASAGGGGGGGDRELGTAMTRARAGVVLSWPETSGRAENRPSPAYVEARSLLGAEEEYRAEELFGPGEGLHATYRMLREDVLEASWLTGRKMFEPRLDTAVDLDRAMARYLELLKLAALAQRPESQPISEAIDVVNGILEQVASPEQLAELEASALDQYLMEEERESRRRSSTIEARKEPSLEAFLPRRGEGVRLSATDVDLYLTCPLKYKFARIFALPQEPTINQRFGILIHSVLDRFHRDRGAEEMADASSLARLTSLFEAGWRRSGFGTSDDELQFRDRARRAMRLYWERECESEGDPVWLEKPFEFRIGPHHVRGRVDRVDRLPNGEHELIDYKTGIRKSREDLLEDLQLSLYRLAASRAWGIEVGSGSYYYVLDAEKVRVEPQPEDAARVERTVTEVGEGILSQDFEPRPSPSVCSWCDYRLVCPAAEE